MLVNPVPGAGSAGSVAEDGEAVKVGWGVTVGFKVGVGTTTEVGVGVGI